MKIPVIKNLDTLEKEIYRLKLRSKEIERKLDSNIDYLKDNYASMAMNSVFGKRGRSTAGFWAGLATRIIESEKLQASLSHLVDTLVEKIGDGVSHVADKIFHKKDE